MDGASPTAAPTSAPTPSPSPAPSGAPPTSAPSSVPVDTGTPTAPGLDTQPGTALEAGPTKPRFPWKTKARVGDAEHELELDLAEYRHRVKVDGEELEVPFEDLGRSYERVRSSMKRFDEAAKMRREVEQREQALAGKVQKLREHLSDPKRALELVRDTLGEEAFYRAIAEEVRARIEYEQLPDDQRSAYDRRTQAERDLARREQEIARREAAIKREEEQRIATLAEQRQKQLIAQWTPALEAAGLPAKIPGKDGQPQPNMRLLRMLADTMRRARDTGAPITLAEAIGEVRAEYEQLVSYEVDRRTQQQRDALSQQPGRADPPVPTHPPAPRATGRTQTAEEFARDLRRSWGR